MRKIAPALRRTATRGSSGDDALDPYLARAWRSGRDLEHNLNAPLSLHVVLTSYDSGFESVSAQLVHKLEELRAVFPAHGPVRVCVRVVDDADPKGDFGPAVDRAMSQAPTGFVVGVNLVREPLFYGSPGRYGRKGLALRQGFLSALDAGADVVAYANLNLKVHAAQLATGLARLLDSAADVAIGTRAPAEGGLALGRSRLGDMKSSIYSRLVRESFPALVPFVDQNAPLKLFSKRATSLIVDRARLDDLAHDVEWLLILRGAGIEIERFGVLWQQRAGSRPPLFAIAPMLADLARLRRAERAGLFSSTSAPST